MRKGYLQFVAGIIIGGALFSGGTAYAAGLMAEPSNQTFFVDGQQVQLQAYSIGGSNYVKLRDVGETVGFNVYWDGAVYIDTTVPYTGTAPAGQITAPAVTLPSQPEQASYTISTGHWSREDFSRQANPAVFTSVFDRDLYNAVRQTLVDMGTENSTGDRCAYTMVSKEDYSAVKRMLGRMDGLFLYEHYVPKNLSNYYEYLDYFAVSAQMPDDYQPALDFIQPVIAAVNRLGTDREKVEYLNDYLCGLLAYNSKATAGIERTFSQHSAELEAACGSYAHNFKFLCAAANIPCFTISTTNHSWNMVYADGQWLHVDVAANDLYRQAYILLEKTVPDRIDQAPEATAFLKELLVPGSTK